MMLVTAHGYSLAGSFEYGNLNPDMTGETIGNAVRCSDGEFLGLVEDKTNGNTDRTQKYLLGLFHERGLSFLKIPPLDRQMHIVCWALEEKSGVYTGGWVPLEVTAEGIGLSVIPSLQALIKIDPKRFEILTPRTFDAVIEDARMGGRDVTLRLTEANLKKVRRELRL